MRDDSSNAEATVAINLWLRNRDLLKSSLVVLAAVGALVQSLSMMLDPDWAGVLDWETLARVVWPLERLTSRDPPRCPTCAG